MDSAVNICKSEELLITPLIPEVKTDTQQNLSFILQSDTFSAFSDLMPLLVCHFQKRFTVSKIKQFSDLTPLTLG